MKYKIVSFIKGNRKKNTSIHNLIEVNENNIARRITKGRRLTVETVNDEVSGELNDIFSDSIIVNNKDINIKNIISIKI